MKYTEDEVFQMARKAGFSELHIQECKDDLRSLWDRSVKRVFAKYENGEL